MAKETIETKIMLEADVASLRREKKTVLRELDVSKLELAEVLNALERNKKLLNDYKDDLVELNNEIAKAKLSWNEEKENNMKELAEEREAIDKKLKELEKIEVEREKVQKLVDKKIDILNENKQILAEMKDLSDAMKKQEEAIERKYTNVETVEKDLEIKKEEFKNKLNKLIEDYV